MNIKRLILTTLSREIKVWQTELGFIHLFGELTSQLVAALETDLAGVVGMESYSPVSHEEGHM